MIIPELLKQLNPLLWLQENFSFADGSLIIKISLTDDLFATHNLGSIQYKK